jgi:hypothetical protein
MNGNEADITAFEPLVGTWATEATHPLIEGVISGTATFEWLDGGRYLIERTTYDHELVPNALGVIGAPEHGDGFVLEYFDSRGVRRTYRTSIEDGVWRHWRDVPGFEQRFAATLAPDAFYGHGELAQTPGEWHDDLDINYRRIA